MLSCIHRSVKVLRITPFIALLAFSNSVWAKPIAWIIPPTTLAGTGNSISGSFVFDADTRVTSEINITLSYEGTTSALTVPASSAGSYIRFVRDTTIGAPGVYIASSALTNAGGSATLTPGQLAAGLCGVITTGVCTNIAGPFRANTAPVTLNSVPEPIPTLSEWAMIFLASLMAMVAMVRVRKHNQ